MTIGMGVLGLGFMGYRQAAIYNELDGVTLIGGADRVPEARERFNGAFQVPTAESLEDLLTTWGSELDALTIVTPHVYHYDQAKRAIEAGLDVFVEKPLALSLAEIEDLFDSASASDRHLQVGYHRRFHPAFQAFRNRLDTGAIGEQRMITGIIGQSWVDLNRDAWRMDPCIGGEGGYLSDTGSHLLEGLHFLADGYPLSVSADLATSDDGVVVNAAIEGTFRTAEGTIPVSLSACGESTNPDVDERLTIWGTGGRITYEKDHRTPGPAEHLEIVTAESSERIVEEASFEELTRAKLEDFTDTVRNGDRPTTGENLVRQIAQFREAALKAGRTGERIDVQEYREEALGASSN